MKQYRAAVAAGLVVFFWVATTCAVHAQDREVVLAGVAYSGDSTSIEKRFPRSKRYEEALKTAGTTANQQALAAVQKAPAEHLKVTSQPIAELKGRDQALVVSLVLNSETVSIERFGDVRKLFVLVRAQALFFDFKSMT